MQYKFLNEKGKHLHTLDDRPLVGTTTALNEIFPPPLAWFGSAMALERFGWITEKKEPDAKKREELLMKGQDEIRLAADMNLEDYRSLLEECYRNHDEYKKSKGKAGTDIHAEIEDYIKFCISNNSGAPTTQFKTDIESFVRWAMKDVDTFLWSEAHVFSEKLWLGGITDFGFIHKNGKMIVGDVKPSVYPKNFIQTALYGIQIKENGLFHANGVPIQGNMPTWAEVIDGYCIFDYNKGIAMYRTDVECLESYGTLAIELYKHKDIIGTPTL